MNTMDLQKFCGNEHEYRIYLHAPWRSSLGIIRSNGHILVCTPDDGGEYPDKVKGVSDTTLTEWRTETTLKNLLCIEVSSIKLPKHRPPARAGVD